MARFIQKSKWFARMEFSRFQGVMDMQVRKSGPMLIALITTPQVNGKRKDALQELADGLQLMVSHAAKSTDVKVNLQGRKVDPDESSTGFTIPVFEKDPNQYLIRAQKNPMDGFVLAEVPAMRFDSDLPSAVQAAHVLYQAVKLMKAYERS